MDANKYNDLYYKMCSEFISERLGLPAKHEDIADLVRHVINIENNSQSKSFSSNSYDTNNGIYGRVV